MTSAAVIQLHPKDSVVIARATLLPGTPVAGGVAAAERIPPGHKVAVVPVAPGEAVRRYNQIIGFATQAIAPGQHVHVHNMGMGDFVKDYAFGAAPSRPPMSRNPRPSRASAGRTGGWRRAITLAS
jgi:arabinonate dehydratase